MFNSPKSRVGIGSKSAKSCDLDGGGGVQLFCRGLFDQLDAVTKAISRKTTSKRGFLSEWCRRSGSNLRIPAHVQDSLARVSGFP